MVRNVTAEFGSRVFPGNAMAQDLLPTNPPASGAAEQTDIVRLAAWLLAGSIILAGLYIGQDILIPLAIAFLISFTLSPLVTGLDRLGLPRLISVIVVMLTVGMLLIGLGALVGSQLRTLSAQLPTYESTIRTKIDDLGKQLKGPGIFDGALRTVDTVQSEVDAAVKGEDDARPVQRIEVMPPPASPLETTMAWVIPAISPLATAGIVTVFVFLALLDSGDLRDRLIRLMGGNLYRSTDAMEEAGRRISKYLLMQLVVNVSYGIPMALGLWFIGVPGWILWGTLAALMRFIPYAGPLLSAIIPISLAFAVDPGWNMVIWTVALIVFLEVVSNNIIEPMLYGTSTGLSAIALIAAATFWTALWGPVGLVLSTPLTVCLLVIGRNLPQLQFLDTLLGSTPVLDVPTRIYQRLIADDANGAIEIVEETIGEGSVTEFYNTHGIEVLRRVSDDYLSNARAEHRLRVSNGMDMLLDDLREDHPAVVDPTLPAKVACIGGKWEIDTIASEMLVHALSLEGILAVLRRPGTITARSVDKLDLDSVDIVCLSYFSRSPESAVRAFCRRLRQRWPGIRIVLAIWNPPEALLDPANVHALGADEVATSVEEAVQRIQRMIVPVEKHEVRTAEAPEDDAARVAALAATNALDGHAREELDALAKRAADVFDVKFAVISAIDAEHEFIIGQSTELPGQLTQEGANMITMRRQDALCDHVVASGERLVINDTERDPDFADHPAVRLWETRFYAGAPLTTADGMVLGALCLLDSEPRKLNDEELALLDAIAADVVSVITGEDAVERPPRNEKGRSAVLGQAVPD